MNRIVDTHTTTGSPFSFIRFRDGSQIKFFMNIYRPRIEAIGPERSFAQLFEKNVIDLKVRFDRTTFFFRDGSELNMDYGDVPRKVHW